MPCQVPTAYSLLSTVSSRSLTPTNSPSRRVILTSSLTASPLPPDSKALRGGPPPHLGAPLPPLHRPEAGYQHLYWARREDWRAALWMTGRGFREVSGAGTMLSSRGTKRASPSEQANKRGYQGWRLGQQCATVAATVAFLQLQSGQIARCCCGGFNLSSLGCQNGCGVRVGPLPPVAV